MKWPDKRNQTEYVRAHNARKKALVEAKRAEGCVDCGEQDTVVIDLHAPNGHTVKGKRIKDGARFSFPDLIFELSICVPLCANCHRRRHAIEGFPQSPGRSSDELAQLSLF